MIAAVGGVATLYGFFLNEHRATADVHSGRLEYSKEILKGCQMQANRIESVYNVLVKATNELKLRDNVTGAQSLFDTVSDELIQCQPILKLHEGWGVLSSFTGIAPKLLLIGLFSLPIAFGILWYKEHKLKHQDVSKG